MPPEMERLLREVAPQALGALTRRYGDFAAAEDAFQEALMAAATQWPRDGAPDNPRAWLYHVASLRLTDQIRSDAARRRRENAAAMEAGYVIPATENIAETEQDDTLTLIFLCCHPALTLSSAISLTLRAVGGLTTAEIAHAFLVPEATMAQRISRAKQTIQASGASFQMPSGEQRTQRLRAVLHVLYLVFNEGYTARTGDSLNRHDLAHEGIRLARAVYALLPDDAEVAGLLALMLLTDARRIARTGDRGEAIPLDQQDRSLWDKDQIAEGVALLSATLPRGMVGSYQLQAAIAAVHDEAEHAKDTDWPQILALYGVLHRIADNPMVRLNQAVAAAMVQGPAAGLEILSELQADVRIQDHHRLHAVRGRLLEMSGDKAGAIASYLAAAARTANLPERNYLLQRAGQLR